MKFDLKIGGVDFSVEVTYKKMKSIRMRVVDAHSIKISAPKNVARKYLCDVVMSKSQWIIKMNSEILASKADYANGGQICYRGKMHEVRLIKEKSLKKIYVKNDGGSFLVYGNSFEHEEVVSGIRDFLKKRAGETVMELYEKHKNSVGQRPVKIKLKDQKTRWGSCSSKGNININYRLVMAPKEVFEYVMVHELCHLVHFNHSKEFWGLVKSILPDYERRKSWLKENQKKLEI